MRGSELETAAWTAWSSIDWNEVAETAAGAVEEVVGGRPEVRIVDVEPDPGGCRARGPAGRNWCTGRCHLTDPAVKIDQLCLTDMLGNSAD